MRTKSFTYNGDVTITVRRGTVRDRLAVDALAWELPETKSTAERHAQRSYAKLVIQTVSVEGDLGFVWRSSNASGDDLAAAYEALMDADGALWDAWNVAILQADGSIADPELAEPPKKTDAADGTAKLVITKSA